MAAKYGSKTCVHAAAVVAATAAADVVSLQALCSAAASVYTHGPVTSLKSSFTEKAASLAALVLYTHQGLNFIPTRVSTAS